MTNLKHANNAKDWSFDVERRDYCIESLALSVQFALQKSMNANCISKKELAERLGVSPARVSQYLASDAVNLTLKTIGKIADALGEEFEMFSITDINELKLKAKKSNDFRFVDVVKIVPAAARVRWEDKSVANDHSNPADYAEEYACAVGQ